MTEVKVWSPDGSRTEMHSIANASDLVRHAGWHRQDPNLVPHDPKSHADVLPIETAQDAAVEADQADSDEEQDDADTATEENVDETSSAVNLTKSDVEKMTQDDLRNLAAKHGVTIDNRWGRAKLIDAVWAAMH